MIYPLLRLAISSLSYGQKKNPGVVKMKPFWRA
jgi:hypothetical protein